jgi:GT2 family glycosyltransferase
VTVVIACHTERRWGQLVKALNSVAAQRPAPAEIVLVVDHNDALRARAEKELGGVTVVANTGAPGASGARNTGVMHSSTEYVAFLDDDAIADPGWLAGLLEPMSDREVIGTGGVAMPRWELEAPRWFPYEFSWVVGATFFDVPAEETTVRNVWAENMAVRRDVFDAVGGFREGFGKLGISSRPEDTDLCWRMASTGEGRWTLAPSATISHFVPRSRSTFLFFLRRCYAEGSGKAQMSALLSEPGALSDEWRYIGSSVPRAVMRRLSRRGPGSWIDAALQAIAIGLGVLFAAAGYSLERARTVGRSA